jgi:hypothetical protein
LIQNLINNMKLKRILFFVTGINSHTLCPLVQAQEKPFQAATAIIPPEDYHTSAPEITAAELAMPPAGEIQKLHLRVVNDSRSELASILASVPEGSGGQGSPWFAKAQSFRMGLDRIAVNRLQVDCFALVPWIEELLKTQNEDVPEFVSKTRGLAGGISETLINAIERHIFDQNAIVSAANRNAFIKVFSVAGFISEGDWEGSPIPIDSAGIMILDAAGVVTQLKTLPWQEADRFLGNATALQAFARYAASGNGMAILKTKYAAQVLFLSAN